MSHRRVKFGLSPVCSARFGGYWLWLCLFSFLQERPGSGIDCPRGLNAGPRVVSANHLRHSSICRPPHLPVWAKVRRESESLRNRTKKVSNRSRVSSLTRCCPAGTRGSALHPPLRGGREGRTLHASQILMHLTCAAHIPYIPYILYVVQSCSWWCLLPAVCSGAMATCGCSSRSREKRLPCTRSSCSTERPHPPHAHPPPGSFQSARLTWVCP